ncbi:MAG TPA: outer membrane protein transport protein [Kofleriaceae bacterium]
MKHTLPVLGALLVTAQATAAFAGGMFLPTRGVHALGRGGAFVAGDDDADALFLNPAGLAELAQKGHWTLYIDVADVHQDTSYARIDSGGNQLAAVKNQKPDQPIPTIAATYAIDNRLVVGVGVGAPYTTVHKYDEDGPQRYSSVSFEDSLFVQLDIGVAYKLTDHLRVGATFEDLISNVSSRIVLGGCPGQTVCAPEDPDFDSVSQVHQRDFVSPSGSIGLQWDAHKYVTLGLAAHAPAKISGTGTVQARLPSSAFFEGASVAGDSGTLALTLPGWVRGGVEVHPIPSLAIEADLDIEFWSEQKDITITPHDIRIENAAGVGTYTFGEMVIPRNFKNSYAPSLGAEWHHGRLMLSAGASYETAAAPKGYVSVITVDAPKILVGAGAGWKLGKTWNVGAALGYAHVDDVNLSLADAKVPQLTPIRDQPSEVIVNAGQYHTKYLVGGVRVSKTF